MACRIVAQPLPDYARFAVNDRGRMMEIQIVKTIFDSMFRQVFCVGWDYVQEEPRLHVCWEAIFLDVGKLPSVEVYVK